MRNRSSKQQSRAPGEVCPGPQRPRRRPRCLRPLLNERVGQSRSTLLRTELRLERGFAGWRHDNGRDRHDQD